MIYKGLLIQGEWKSVRALESSSDRESTVLPYQKTKKENLAFKESPFSKDFNSG